MRVFRGPASTEWNDKSHELVSVVSPNELQYALEMKVPLKFNISKDATKRQAVGSILFEDRDLLPIVHGILARLEAEEKTLNNLKEILVKNVTAEEKIAEIKRSLGIRR